MQSNCTFRAKSLEFWKGRKEICKPIKTYPVMTCRAFTGCPDQGVTVKSQKNTFLRKEEITGIKIENQKEKIKEDISYSRPAII